MNEKQERGNARQSGTIGKRREVLEFSAIIIGFMVVAALLTYAGYSHRRFLPEPRVQRISAPHDAAALWTEQHVQGRVLILFDRQLNAEKGSSRQEDSYVFQAIQTRIIRKIYHVIPDAFWKDVCLSLGQNRFAARSGAGFRMAAHEGVPVMIIRVKDIPCIREKALISINSDCWSDPELGLIVQQLREGRLRSDLITISGRISELDAQGVQHAMEAGV